MWQHLLTYSNWNKDVVLLHLEQMWHGELIRFEAHQLQMSINEIQIAFSVSNNQLASTVCTCRDINTLETRLQKLQITKKNRNRCYITIPSYIQYKQSWLEPCKPYEFWNFGSYLLNFCNLQAEPCKLVLKMSSGCCCKFQAGKDILLLNRNYQIQISLVVGDEPLMTQSRWWTFAILLLNCQCFDNVGWVT